MADALAVLGSQLLRVGGSGQPIIWFAHQDAPAGAFLSTSMLGQTLAIEDYEEWYEEIVGFLAYGHLPASRYKA